MTPIERIENILREFQVKAFSKVLLTGALALGGLTVMNIETPKAHADGVSEFCRYICGPTETLNGVTVQVHATEYSYGQNMIAKITNDRAEDVRYRVTIEKKWASGWGYYETDFNLGPNYQLEQTKNFTIQLVGVDNFQKTGNIVTKLKLKC